MVEEIKGMDGLVTASKQISIAIGLLNQAITGVFPSWTAGQIPGTTTNGDATAGNVGEYISSTILSGSAVSLVTGTAKNVTSISLTGGDWDVWGSIGFTANAATTATEFSGGINTATNTLPTPPGNGAFARLGISVGAGGVEPVFPLGSVRVPLSSTTTIYLVAESAFAVNSMSAFGFIAARRRR